MTNDTENINLVALAAALQRVIDDYKLRGIHDVSMPETDAYWTVATDEMFDMTADVSESIGVGSVDDDLTELAKLMQDPDRPATAVDFERLGNLLRAVSESLVE